jgi:tetraprenyl-beta-curcumene synthase
VCLAVGREMTWGLAEVRSEIDALRRRAERIADPALRRDALHALRQKRTHADGAALFAILPRRRHAGLVRLLVVYETILDFLDEVSERHPTEANGRELHLALIDALVPERRLADYYRHHPERCDGGYLDALVERCRELCGTLPSFDEVRAQLTREVWRTQVLGLNHVLPAARRDDLLRDWVREEFFDDEHSLDWFELSAAASASLVVHSLLALASEPGVIERQVQEVRSAYWPWTSLVTAMLDSYVDVDDDRESGNHSYIGHYRTERCAISRLCDCIRRAATQAAKLPNGRRHTIILSAMIAMYLSKDSARVSARRPARRRLLRAGGMLPRLLLPALLAWRTAYALRSA